MVVRGYLSNFIVFGCAKFLTPSNDIVFLRQYFNEYRIPNFREHTKPLKGADRTLLTLTSAEIETKSNLGVDTFVKMARNNERFLKNEYWFYPLSKVIVGSKHGVVQFGCDPSGISRKVISVRAGQKVEFALLDTAGQVIDDPEEEEEDHLEKGGKVGLVFRKRWFGSKICVWLIPMTERDVVGRELRQRRSVTGTVIESHPSNNNVVSGLVTFNCS